MRLRTLADAFAYAEAGRVDLRVNSTEVQVRRPRTGLVGRKAFGSGKKKQNTAKTTTISDGSGRLLWSGADRPGRLHDQTAMRTEGIAEQFRLHPTVKAEVKEGYRGLANEFPDQVSAPPEKPKDDAPLGEQHSWREQRRRQSFRRICVAACQKANVVFDVIPGRRSRDSGLGRLTLPGASCSAALCGHVCPSYRRSTGVWCLRPSGGDDSASFEEDVAGCVVVAVVHGFRTRRTSTPGRGGADR